MSHPASTIEDAVEADMVAPFVVERVRVVPGREVTAPDTKPLYQAREVGKETANVLPNDPNVDAPIPMLRLVVNVSATFILVLAAGLATAATAPKLLGFDPVVVSSGSMEPAIHVADVVVTAKSDGMGLGEGAVVNFESEGTMLLHRIAAVTEQGYRTAGDANRVADSGLVEDDQIRGVGVVIVPFAGLPAMWIENNNWPMLTLAIAVLASAAYTARGRWVEDPGALLP